MELDIDEEIRNLGTIKAGGKLRYVYMKSFALQIMKLKVLKGLDGGELFFF